MKHLALTALLVLACSPAAAQVAISRLPAAAPLTGSEAIPVVQSGQTLKATASQFVMVTADQSVAGVKTFTAASIQMPVLVQMGGTTNTAPALKRNAAAVDVRLADDSGYAPINTSVATSTSYSVTTAHTVATLPTAASAGAGARSFVTDATACTFASAVTGGGSTSCPVYSDGTTWKAG